MISLRLYLNYLKQKQTLLTISRFSQPQIRIFDTECCGRSQIFTRDIIAVVRELKEDRNRYYMIAVIVALNWSVTELGNISEQIDKVFHFNMNPNKFVGFDEASQIQLNKYIQGVLDNG